MKSFHHQRVFYNIFIFISLTIVGCDWPFDTKVTEGDSFSLTLTSNINRVMPSDNIHLSWSEITVDGHFNGYIIERRQMDDNWWETVTTITDRFQLSYLDTIYDDEDLQYRVGLSTVEGNIVWADDFIEVPNTNNISVPDEFSKIQDAVDSPLVDNDDTVWVQNGIYTENILILGKDVTLKSTAGRDDTIIDGNKANVTVVMNNSIVDGFTIIRGVAENKLGGGVLINGNGTIQNCRIQNNFAEVKGGGIYINGNANVYNTIIYYNTSGTGKGIHIKDCSGEIINNTIVGNDITIEGDCNGLTLRNNIIYQSQPDISFLSNDSQNGVTIDYSLFDQDVPLSTNYIIENPRLKDYLSFELLASSPCIDAGHPDAVYNDTDNTRNDMGAFGGPAK